jgi:hypothetical protein
MQDKDYINLESEKNKEIVYTSDVLKDLLPGITNEKQFFNTLATDNGNFDVKILMHSKTKSKTNIKLLIKNNVVSDLILSSFLDLKIKNKDQLFFVFDFKQSNLLKSSVYLNSSEDTIVKIKFLNESEK